MERLGLREWTKKKCKPCEGGALPIGAGEAQSFANGLGGGWKLAADGKSLRADYLLRDFAAGAELIGRIAKLAEEEGHHPDLHLTGYRRLCVELSTHAIGGLSENDFILAAKIEALPKALKGQRPG